MKNNAKNKNTKKNLRKEVYDRIKHKIKELTLFRMGVGGGGGGGGVGVQKSPTTSFSPVTSTKVGLIPKNLLTFCLNPWFQLV